MAFARDTYYAALFARLQAKVPGVATWSRKHLHFSRLPAGTAPVGLLLVANQAPEMAFGLPTVWRLGADLVLWVRTTGQEDNLDTVLCELVDAVEAALLADADDTHAGQTATTQSTLGGLVQELTIAGPVDFNQTEGAESASVVIPIDMVVLGDDPADG